MLGLDSKERTRSRVELIIFCRVIDQRDQGVNGAQGMSLVH